MVSGSVEGDRDERAESFRLTVVSPWAGFVRPRPWGADSRSRPEPGRDETRTEDSDETSSRKRTQRGSYRKTAQSGTRGPGATADDESVFPLPRTTRTPGRWPMCPLL